MTATARKASCLIVDDVYTTGKSINAVFEAIEYQDAEFMVVIDRSGYKDIDAIYNEKEEDFKKK